MKIIKKSIVFLVIMVLVVGTLPTNAFAVKPARKVYVRMDIDEFTYEGDYGSGLAGTSAIPVAFTFAAQAVAVVQSILAAASGLI